MSGPVDFMLHRETEWTMKGGSPEILMPLKSVVPGLQCRVRLGIGISSAGQAGAPSPGKCVKEV